MSESLARLALRAQVLRAREDPAEFGAFVGRREGDRPIRVGKVHRLWQRLLSENDRYVLFAPVGAGKALDVDTEIPTPTGWVRIRDLAPGDTVFDMDGQPTGVTWVGPTYTDHECYRITFADGATCVADAGHQWLVGPTGSPGGLVLRTDTLCPGLAVPNAEGGLVAHRAVVAVEPVPARPVCCIAVDAPSRTFLATRDYIVTHNSNWVTRWRVEWELGRNPDLRVGVVSVAKSGVPQKFLSAIRGDIEENRRLRLVFPGLRPSTGSQRMWGSSGLIVQRRYSQPDPSLQTFGLYGKILGSRLDLIILDDVCNLENTLTAQSRDKMWDWLSGEVFSRLPPEGGGRIWAVGHVWDQDDVMERMRRSGWPSRKFSAWVRDPRTDQEIPLIPELWAKAHLERRERELGPIMSSLMLRNRLPDRSAGSIKLEWFHGCIARGEGLRCPPAWNPVHAPTYTGVDLGTGVGRDRTVIFTACVLPDGSRQILDVRSGDWAAPDIVSQLVDVHTRYGSQVMVESNAAQRFLAQFASQLTAIPMREHHTGANKRDLRFGVESLGLEVYNGKWIIPAKDGAPVRCSGELDSSHGEIALAIRELCAFSPDPKVHTGDRAMAWWICREAIRTSAAGDGYSEHPDTSDWEDVWDSQRR